MTTATNISGQTINDELITALYCRLSVEDIKDDKSKKNNGREDESNSISNQDGICQGVFLQKIFISINSYDQK